PAPHIAEPLERALRTEPVFASGVVARAGDWRGLPENDLPALHRATMPSALGFALERGWQQPRPIGWIRRRLGRDVRACARRARSASPRRSRQPHAGGTAATAPTQRAPPQDDPRR